MLHSWKYSLWKSRAAKTTHFASKSADSGLLWYAIREGGFLGKQQCDVLAYFGMQVPGCNKHTSWQTAINHWQLWKGCFIQQAFGFHFEWLICVSFGDYCANCSDTRWWWSSSFLWPGSLQKPEICCDYSAVCNKEQEETHSWKVVFPGNE